MISRLSWFSPIDRTCQFLGALVPGVTPLLQDGFGRGWRFAVLRHSQHWAHIKLLSTVAMPCVYTTYDFTFVPWTSFAVCPRLSHGHESKADIRGYTISFEVEKCSRFAEKHMGPGVISEICEYEQHGGSGWWATLADVHIDYIKEHKTRLVSWMFRQA